MVLVGIAVLIVTTAIILSCVRKNDLYLLIICIAVPFLMIGLIAPLHGYEPLVTEKYELYELASGIYVIHNQQDGYICSHEGSEEINSKENTNHLQYDTGYEKVVFIEEGETPVLIKYKRKAKKSIWTFALGMTEINNVFFIPKSAYEDL